MDVQFSLARPPRSKLAIPLTDVLRIKIISLGATGAGKSCLIKRYSEERVCTALVSIIMCAILLNAVCEQIHFNHWSGLWSKTGHCLPKGSKSKFLGFSWSARVF